MLDALLLGGERFEQGLNRGAVGVLSGLAALQVGLNLREISVEGFLMLLSTHTALFVDSGRLSGILPVARIPLCRLPVR
jgi:hypothetical protein